MNTPSPSSAAPAIDMDTIVSIDLETTGLDHRTERIIEVGAVKLVNGEITESFSSLVKPDVPIRHSSFMVHGISEEMVAEAPTIEQVLPEVLAFIGDSTVVAHNAIFDCSFLNESCKRVLDKRFDNPRIDTYEMFKTVFPEETSHGLSALLARFGFDNFVAHRALDDARCLAQVFPKLQAMHQQQMDWQFSQLANVPYLVERYLRLQKAAQGLQAEISDLREVFKLYFQQGGRPVTATSGDIMTTSWRRHYEYDDVALRKIIDEAGLQAQGYKVNSRYIDKLIDKKQVDPDVLEALKEARVRMFESRQVSFSKPQEPTTAPAAAATETTPVEPPAAE